MNILRAIPMALPKSNIEMIRVLAVGDLQCNRPRQPSQLVGARIRDHADHQLRCSARHGRAVLQDKAAAAALRRSRDFLHRDVTRRACHAGRSCQHYSFARSFKIAVELLVLASLLPMAASSGLQAAWGVTSTSKWSIASTPSQFSPSRPHICARDWSRALPAR